VTPVVDAVLAMRPTALLHAQATKVLSDQVFVMPASAMVILCRDPDRAALDQALAQLPAIQTGAFDPLRISVAGNAIILGRMDLSRAPTASSVSPDVTYTAVYNHRAEWPHYKKLFDVVDTHAASPEMAVSSSVPAFFSGNVQSLGETLPRLRSASITSADRGAIVEETIRYQLAQP